MSEKKKTKINWFLILGIFVGTIIGRILIYLFWKV